MSEPCRIAVAMSGGVDSSTAAAILKEEGHNLVGFSMQLWDQRRNGPAGEEQRGGRCCSIDDLYDARSVAARLGFPYYVVNFQREFEREVVRPFIEGYLGGVTPSPCVLCNSHMKFDHLLQTADEVGAAYVATGHYARIARDSETGRYMLLKGRDPDKDQSYFLFGLRQEQLARALFPLGDLRKQQVRGLARRHSLPVAEKPESQEICFVPDNDYAGFIERHYNDVCGRDEDSDPFASGEIVDLEGKALGKHPGIHHYTIGQRRGLGLAHPSPLYVIDLQPESHRVVVGERPQLGKSLCRVVRPNWISIAAPDAPVRVSAKIRSRHAESPATVTPMEYKSLLVEFDTPQLAVTPGQAAVFYDGDRVIGGGWITRHQP